MRSNRLLITGCFSVLISSCVLSGPRRAYVTVLDEDGKPISSATISSQPILLFGPGNQSDNKGRLQCAELQDRKFYEIGKDNYGTVKVTFDELKSRKTVVLLKLH